jgi:hypothetical protein
MRYDFEWDPHKAALNLRKHRVSFARASGVFRGPNAISIADEEHSETEERWVTIGLDQSEAALVVIHTYAKLDNDQCKIRIISARRATKNEILQLLG